MAFEEGLGSEFGTDPSQPGDQNYILGATGIVSKTISLWARNIVRYIAIVGLIGAACVTASYLILLLMFGSVGTIGADPISYLIGLFFLMPESTLLLVSVGFAIFAFVLNAIIYGAAIKYTLDEYGGTGGDVGASFSHSLRRVLNVIIVQSILTFIAAIIFIPATALALQAFNMIGPIDPYSPVFPDFPPGSIEMLFSAMGLFIGGGIFLIYFNTRFAPTLAIVIDTDLSVIDSLRRSWELTSGNFFHVFGSFLLMNIVVVIFSVIVSSLGTSVGIVLEFTTLQYDYLYVIETMITALLFSALTFIFTTVLYRDLSSRTHESSVSSSLDDLRVI